MAMRHHYRVSHTYNTAITIRSHVVIMIINTRTVRSIGGGSGT